MRRGISSALASAATAVIVAGLYVGCDKSDSKPSTGTPPMIPTTPSIPTDATPPATGPSADADSTPADAPAIPAAATETPAAPAAPAAQGRAEATSKAEELISQATNYIKENKLDLAEKALTELDKLKPQLPASFAPKIDTARSALEAAKTKDAANNLLGK